MAARRKANPGPDKMQAKRAPPPSSGGALFSTLFLLAILGGVGYAVVRIPVGERTLAEQASSWVQKQFRTRPRPVRPTAPKKDLAEQTPDASGEKATAKAETREPAKAGAKVPAKTETKTEARATATPPAEAKAMDRAIAKLAAMDPKSAKKPAAAPPAHPGFSPDEKKAIEKLMR